MVYEGFWCRGLRFLVDVKVVWFRIWCFGVVEVEVFGVGI